MVGKKHRVLTTFSKGSFTFFPAGLNIVFQ